MPALFFQQRDPATDHIHASYANPAYATSSIGAGSSTSILRPTNTSASAYQSTLTPYPTSPHHVFNYYSQASPQLQPQIPTTAAPTPTNVTSTTSSLTPAPTPIAGVKRKHGPTDEDDQDQGQGRGGGLPKTVRKRRIRLSLGDPEGEGILETLGGALGGGGGGGDRNNGGAKHWTDDEKGRLFNWMLNSDEHWEMFATQMNTIFRDAAARLFDNKKSFTALKSCYHRNVETFKQIYAFEVFLVQYSTGSTTDGQESHDIVHAPIPASFTSSIHRQTFLERKLEAARSIGGVPVGNLNVKVIDHWYRMGWYALFRRRYREDPQTGQLAPYHGPATFPSESQTAPLFPQPPPQSAYPPPTDIDPSLLPNGGASGSGTGIPGEEEEDEDEDAEHEQDLGHNPEMEDPQDPSTGNLSIDTLGLSQRQALNQDPTICIIPPPFPVSAPPMPQTPSVMPLQRPHLPPKPQSTESIRSQVSSVAPSQVQSHAFSSMPPYVPAVSDMSGGFPQSTPAFSPKPPSSGTYVQQQQHLSPQVGQALAQLTGIAQSLMTTCTTLTEFLKIQAEETKLRIDLLRRSERQREDDGDAREGMDKKEKATLATSVLSNPAVDDHVKQAAADYLKRLFASD